MFNVPNLNYLKPFGLYLKKQKNIKKNLFKQNAIYIKKSCFLYNRQIEACRKILRKYLGKKSKIIIHVNHYKPYSYKPKETRMGRGKGNNFKWRIPIKAGSLLLSFQQLFFNKVNTILLTNLIKSKLPTFITIQENKKNNLFAFLIKPKNKIFL